MALNVQILKTALGIEFVSWYDLDYVKAEKHMTIFSQKFLVLHIILTM